MSSANISQTLVRALRVIVAMGSDDGVSIAEIKRLVGCSLRTAYRYRDAIERAGVEIHCLPSGQGKRYRIFELEGLRIRMPKRAGK